MKPTTIKTLWKTILLLSLFPLLNGCQYRKTFDGKEFFYPVAITKEMTPSDKIEIVVKSDNGGSLYIYLDDVENVYRAPVPWKATVELSDTNGNEEIRERTYAGQRNLYWKAVGKGNTFCYGTSLCTIPLGEIKCKLRFNESMLNAIRNGSIKLSLLHYTEEEKQYCLAKKVHGYLLRPREKK